MSQEVYCVAQTENQAHEVVARLKEMGIAPDVISIVTEPAGVERIAHPDAQHLRNAINGAIVGAVIGILFGIAVLSTMGYDGIPNLFSALLLAGASAFGGALLGSIIGSTGLFGKTVMPESVAQHLEEEVRRGAILIMVEVRSEKERDSFMATLNRWGISDIHFSGEAAA